MKPDYDEMIAVLQAARDGKGIQARAKGDDYPWLKVSGNPRWNFDAREYRPEPEPLRLWVNVHPLGYIAYATREQAINHEGGAIRIAVPMIEVTDG